MGIMRIVLLDTTRNISWDLGYSVMSFEGSAYFVITDSIRTLPAITIENGDIDSTINRENNLKLILPDESGFLNGILINQLCCLKGMPVVISAQR